MRFYGFQGQERLITLTAFVLVADESVSGRSGATWRAAQLREPHPPRSPRPVTRRGCANANCAASDRKCSVSSFPAFSLVHFIADISDNTLLNRKLDTKIAKVGVVRCSQLYVFLLFIDSGTSAEIAIDTVILYRSSSLLHWMRNVDNSERRKCRPHKRIIFAGPRFQKVMIHFSKC